MALPDTGNRVSPKETAPGPKLAPPGPKRRRPIYTLAWAILLLIIVAAGVALHRRNAAADPRATGGGVVSTATVAVSMGDLTSSVRVNGTIVAERSAAIRAPRILGSRGDFNRGGAHDHGPGAGGGGHPDFTLALLRLAKGGTMVKAGDVVAEFDAENQVQRLDDYRDSVVQLKNSIRRMVANLAAAKEAHEQKVRTAHADWRKALLDLKTTSVRSEIDAEKMRLTAEETELKYQRLVAEQALVEESQQASIRSSEMVLAKSAIELDRAQINVKRMTMTAPIDGVVVIGNVVLNGELRQIREGDQVSAGQPFLYVVDTSSMALNGTANQVDAEKMRIGMKATVRLDAYPALSVGGTLVGVGAMARVSTFRAGYVGEIPVRFKIEGADHRLLPDLTGSADVVLHAENNVLVAPRPALFTENGKHFVFVQQRDGWIRKPVTTGLHSPTHVVIRAGLEPGEIIALQQPM